MGLSNVENEGVAMGKSWKPIIDRAICTGCGECVAQCPEGALSLANAKPVVAQADACTYCGLCETLCPVHAISLPYLVTFANPPVSDAGIR